MPWRYWTIAVLVWPVCRTLPAQTSADSFPAFRWLDRQGDAAILAKIQAGFVEELKPDDAETVKPVEAMLYKFVELVGIFRSNALVVIEERDRKDYPYGNYDLFFNYDVKTGQKSQVPVGFWRWKPKGTARFEPSSAPDIVFTYLSCTECETTFLLGSFRFDSLDGNWKVRQWGANGQGIMIGADTTVGGDEDDFATDCLYRVADFDGDGSDDIAVRCVVTGETTKSVDDTTTLYTIKNGRPQIIQVKDRSLLASMRQKLCIDVKNSKLCKAK
jgi:hypothetical protein